MAVINWIDYEEKNHVLSWLICEAMTREQILEMKANNNFDSTKLDVKITVNGEEVNILEAFEFLNSQLGDIEKRGFDRGFKRAMTEIPEALTDFLEMRYTQGGRINE